MPSSSMPDAGRARARRRRCRRACARTHRAIPSAGRAAQLELAAGLERDRLRPGAGRAGAHGGRPEAVRGRREPFELDADVAGAAGSEDLLVDEFVHGVEGEGARGAGMVRPWSSTWPCDPSAMYDPSPLACKRFTGRVIRIFAAQVMPG